MPLDDALEGLDARFDHVAIGAASLGPLLALYRDVLGGVGLGGGVNTVLGFRTYQLGFPDMANHVELIVPVSGSTFLDSFLARTGGLGGLHHVTFIVPSVHQAIEVLNARGYATFGERPDDPSWAEAFVHPRVAGGVLLQVATPGDSSDWGEQWEPDSELVETLGGDD